MRLMHLVLGVFLTALMLTAARDLVGRVALVVFFTGLGEFIIGTVAVMTLFQTIGSIGHARNLVAYATAIGATALVIVVATITMDGLLWVGIRLLQIVAE